MRTRGILGRWGSAVAGLLLLVSTAEAQRISPSGGSTTITTSTATDLTGLLLGNGADVDAYAGTSCTNQFPRSLNASGVATCASVANADLAGSIAASKLVGTDIATVGTITTGTWNAGAVTSSGSVQAASGSQLLISTDTGIRRDAAGSLSFTNGSTGHATGLGLGTTTPKTVLSTTLVSDAVFHILAATNAGHGIIEGTSSQLWIVAASNSAGQRIFGIDNSRFVGNIVQFHKLADAGTSSAVYLSMSLNTDVVTLGSASVAGVNYISGTGNHTFSDGNIIAAVAIGTGTATYAAAPIGTVGSGTGVTVDVTGDYRRVINKATLTYAAWAAAATTADKTIYTLAAKQRLVGIIADVTATFTGGAVSDADMTCGKTAGGNEYLVSFDVDTATGTYGDADAELGTSINRAGAIQGGDLPSWSATTAITCRLTTVGANTDALTAGSITFYIITEMM